MRSLTQADLDAIMAEADPGREMTPDEIADAVLPPRPASRPRRKHTTQED